MRLIDADALLTTIEVKCPMENDLDSFTEGMRVVLKKIYDAPTVDAVSVNEYRQVKFFNAEGIYEAFFPIKLNLDIVNRIQIGNEKFVSVVRCEDCAKRGTLNCDLDYCGYRKADNWYCADGERME